MIKYTDDDWYGELSKPRPRNYDLLHDMAFERGTEDAILVSNMYHDDVRNEEVTKAHNSAFGGIIIAVVIVFSLLFIIY